MSIKLNVAFNNFYLSSKNFFSVINSEHRKILGIVLPIFLGLTIIACIAYRYFYSKPAKIKLPLNKKTETCEKNGATQELEETNKKKDQLSHETESAKETGKPEEATKKTSLVKEKVESDKSKELNKGEATKEIPLAKEKETEKQAQLVKKEEAIQQKQSSQTLQDYGIMDPAPLVDIMAKVAQEYIQIYSSKGPTKKEEGSAKKVMTTAEGAKEAAKQAKMAEQADLLKAEAENLKILNGESEITKNGITYKGLFKNGMLNGEKGIMTDGMGTKWEGTFENDQLIEGRISFSKNHYWQGKFKDGRLHDDHGEVFVRLQNDEEWIKKGKFVDGVFISGIFTKKNISQITAVREGVFNKQEELTEGTFSVFGKDGNIIQWEKGTFTDLSLIEGEKWQRSYQNTLKYTRGTYENDTLLNGTKIFGTVNEYSNSFDLKKLQKTKKEAGEFEGGQLKNGKITYYKANGEVNKIEDGEFVKGQLQKGGTIIHYSL